MRCCLSCGSSHTSKFRSIFEGFTNYLRNIGGISFNKLAINAVNQIVFYTANSCSENRNTRRQCFHSDQTKRFIVGRKYKRVSGSIYLRQITAWPGKNHPVDSTNSFNQFEIRPRFIITNNNKIKIFRQYSQSLDERLEPFSIELMTNEQ